MEPRLIARLLAAGRIGIGIGLFAAPRTAGRLWFGTDLDGPGAALARGLGARDLVIGVGTLVSLDEGYDPGGWLDAGIAADVADAGAAALGRRELGTRVAVGTMAVAGSAAALGLWLKQGLAPGARRA